MSARATSVSHHRPEIGTPLAAMGQLAERPLEARSASAIGFLPAVALDEFHRGARAAGRRRHAQLPFGRADRCLKPCWRRSTLPISADADDAEDRRGGAYASPSIPRRFLRRRGRSATSAARRCSISRCRNPQQDVLFYTIEQKTQDAPVIERRPACLSCPWDSLRDAPRAGPRSARSVFHVARRAGARPDGSYDTDNQRAPVRRRWGGLSLH